MYASHPYKNRFGEIKKYKTQQLFAGGKLNCKIYNSDCDPSHRTEHMGSENSNHKQKLNRDVCQTKL